MKKEEMVIGKEYLHCDPDSNRPYVFVSHHKTNKRWGNFSDPVSGIDYVLIFSHMTEAPQAKPEFNINDDIEISFNSSFDDPTKGKFKYLDPQGDYWMAQNSNGEMMFGGFARKFEPMIRISEYGELDYWEITQAHMDKIKAGDFNV